MLGPAPLLMQPPGIPQLRPAGGVRHVELLSRTTRGRLMASYKDKVTEAKRLLEVMEAG